MKIWHISDTHGHHNLLPIPKGIDIVVHTGDFSNWRDPYRNENEVRTFAKWYSKLPIKHKVLIAGNHDTAVEKGLITKGYFASLGIEYLFCETILIEGYHIWGAPFSPSFMDWAFNKSRHKIGMIWDTIPEYTDILLTHGPPRSILDVAPGRYDLELVGDTALYKKVLEVNPLLHCFGHLHNHGVVINAGIRELPDLDTIFSNGSVVTDHKFGHLTSVGNIIDLPSID